MTFYSFGPPSFFFLGLPLPPSSSTYKIELFRFFFGYSHLCSEVVSSFPLAANSAQLCTVLVFPFFFVATFACVDGTCSKAPYATTSVEVSPGKGEVHWLVV